MFKNTTPRTVARYVAVLLSVAILLLLAVFYGLGLLQVQWWVLLIIGLAFFVSVYYLMIFILRQFIYRKVKLIYKSIHKSKRKGKDKPDPQTVVKMDEDIFGAVEKEVQEWAASQEKEMESLRAMEEYRRDFLGNISHELKTPIFNMQGYLFTLIEGGLYDPKINEDYLKRALHNVQRLQTIVDDLDIIAKLESDRIILDFTAFDIRELIYESIEDNSMFAEQRGITVKFKEGTAIPFKVKADRETIRTVLNNLIGNSIKYGKDAGQTRVGCYDMESYILIEIADNGIGIAEKDRKHVFDRFYRADKSRARTVDGSGLGLSIVKHIIEAHEQTISLRSEMGEGSTFGFTLRKA
jgi:two-component system phosphate regulon sensor histidine kinase PhoR